MRNSIVLLSGGLDSTLSLGLALEKDNVKLALTFDYKQKSNRREIEAASNISKYYKVPHRIIRIPWLGELADSVLVDRRKKIPEFRFNHRDPKENAKLLWIPNRNALFINIGVCFAEALGCNLVVGGFNREEGEIFPDNSKEFIEAINATLNYSVLSKISIVSYIRDLDKEEIVKEAIKINIPWNYIWVCYGDGDLMCGRCESCQRTKRALQNTGNMKILKERFYDEE